jgi:hypothetical protein
MPISLNSRHKAGLFLTTVVAGLCLILGETLRETLGAIIIGFALTWAFGSTSRVLRYCIAGLGVLLFLVPFIAALIDHHNAMQSYEQSLESFRLQLPLFAKEHPDLAAGLVPPPGYTLDPRILTVPNVGKISFPGNMSSRDIAVALRADKGHSQPPDWYYQALDAGIDPSQTDWLIVPNNRPKTLDIWHTISAGALFEVPSAILAILFFGSIAAERKRPAR